jgi:hypothetical protein
MQLAIGRRRVLELRFSVALRERVDDACTTVKSGLRRGVLHGEKALQWERDKYAGIMLSDWDSTIGKRQ